MKKSMLVIAMVLAAAAGYLTKNHQASAPSGASVAASQASTNVGSGLIVMEMAPKIATTLKQQ